MPRLVACAAIWLLTAAHGSAYEYQGQSAPCCAPYAASGCYGPGPSCRPLGDGALSWLHSGTRNPYNYARPYDYRRQFDYPWHASRKGCRGNCNHEPAWQPTPMQSYGEPPQPFQMPLQEDVPVY